MSLAPKALLAALMLTVPAGHALAQAPEANQESAAGQWSPEQAEAFLADHGFTRIELEDTERDHYEFDALDADGREIDIEIGFDGTVISFDVDDDQRATNADLMALLPQDLQDALAQYDFAEITEYDRGSRNHRIEGYTNDGRETEVALSLEDLYEQSRR